MFVGGLNSDFPSELIVFGRGSAFSYPSRGDFQFDMARLLDECKEGKEFCLQIRLSVAV